LEWLPKKRAVIFAGQESKVVAEEASAFEKKMRVSFKFRGKVMPARITPNGGLSAGQVLGATGGNRILTSEAGPRYA
jgi:acetyl-CoA acetyltransferase